MRDTTGAAPSVGPVDGANYGRCRDTSEGVAMITDPTLIRIGEVVQLSHQGEREAARHQAAEI
jgi:hypothetical protein